MGRIINCDKLQDDLNELFKWSHSNGEWRSMLKTVKSVRCVRSAVDRDYFLGGINNNDNNNNNNNNNILLYSAFLLVIQNALQSVNT